MEESFNWFGFLILICRTHSFDDSNPRAARKGRKAVNNSVKNDLLEPDVGRRRSWHSHSEEIRTNTSDFGTSGKRKNVHIAPIVIVATPVIEENPTSISVNQIDPVSEKKSATNPNSPDLPYNHYIHQNKKERRPSIVKRNFKKIFGK